MRHAAVLAALAGTLLLAGCGTEEVRDKGPTVDGRPADELPPNVVARVGDEDITKDEARHWAEAAERQGEQAEQAEQGCRGTAACRKQAMQFLVSAEWLIQHARETGVAATDGEVTKEFNKQKRQAFPREKDYRKFLKESGRSESDLRFQVKLSILTNKLQKSVVGGAKAKTQQQRLDAFVAHFRRRYKRQTICRRAYAPKKQCGKIVD